MVSMMIEKPFDRGAYWALAATFFSIAFSIALGQVFAGVCLLLFLVAAARREIRLCWPLTAWMWLLFAAVACAVTLAVSRGGDPLKRCVKLGWFLLIPMAASLMTSPRRLRGLLRAFLLGCSVLSLRVLVINPVRAWRDPTPDFLTRLIDLGSMTHAQMLMLGLLAALALSVADRHPRMGAFWAGGQWALMGVIALALILSFKRGSWLCAMGLAGAFALRHARRALWVGLMAAVLLAMSLPPVRVRMAQIRAELQMEKGGRLAMWTRVAPTLARRHPMGVGYAGLTNRMMRRVDPRIERNRNHVHNNPLQVLIETGWIGLAVYLVWMAVGLRDALRLLVRSRAAPVELEAPALACLLMLSGLMLNGLVEYNFGDTELMMVYAILFGCMGGLCAWLSPAERLNPAA